MEQRLRQRAESIWTAAIRSVLPDEAVRRALEHFHPQGRVFLVAAGKAAWQMAHAALAVLGRVDGGIVITKYGHVRGPLPGVDLLRGRASGAGRQQLCGHPAGAGACQRSAGGRHRAVSALRRRQRAV